MYGNLVLVGAGILGLVYYIPNITVLFFLIHRDLLAGDPPTELGEVDLA